MWITSGKWDLFWVMGNFWLLPLAVLVSLAGSANFERMIFLVGAFISGTHFVSPLLNTTFFLNNGSPEESRRTVFYRTGVIFFLTAVLAFLAGGGAGDFVPGLSSGALKILFTIYFLWNAWHFSTQHYGILSLYSKGGSFVQNKILDKYFCLAIVFILTPNVWMEIFNQEALLPANLRNFLSILLTSYVIWSAWRRKAPRTLIFYYLCIGAIPLSGLILSPVSHYLLYSVSHWMAEIGLSSRLQPGMQKNKIGLSHYFRFGLGPLVLIGSMVYFTCKSGLWGFCGTTVIQKEGLSNLGEFSLGLWLMLTLAFALPYLHFDLSRFLYGYNARTIFPKLLKRPD